MQVLVASDAVGMGLNLNIRRIIFHSLRKFEGGCGLSECGCSEPVFLPCHHCCVHS